MGVEVMMDDDEVVTIRITLTIRANLDAFAREYGHRPSVKEFRRDVRDSVLGIVDQVTYPEGTGIIEQVKEQ